MWSRCAWVMAKHLRVKIESVAILCGTLGWVNSRRESRRALLRYANAASSIAQLTPQNSSTHCDVLERLQRASATPSFSNSPVRESREPTERHDCNPPGHPSRPKSTLET